MMSAHTACVTATGKRIPASLAVSETSMRVPSWIACARVYVLMMSPGSNTFDHLHELQERPALVVSEHGPLPVLGPVVPILGCAFVGDQVGARLEHPGVTMATYQDRRDALVVAVCRIPLLAANRSNDWHNDWHFVSLQVF